MIVARTVPDVRATLLDRRDGSIALVPTMGAYHEGHLALFRAARAGCGTCLLYASPSPRDQRGTRMPPSA